MQNFNRLFTFAFLMCLCVTVIQAQYVTSSADDGTDGTLRKEIADTPDGGLITIGDMVEQISLTEEILIDKDLTIAGSSAVTVLDADFNGRVFNILEAAVVLSDLELKNGTATDGGAIYLTNSSLSATNVLIDNCVADGASGSGGGIYVSEGSLLILSDCLFTNNVANRAGGAIEVNTTSSYLAMELTNVNFMNNNAGVSPAMAAPGNGGAIHITGPANSTITGTEVSANVAASEGGGFWNGTGFMLLTDANIMENVASGAGADNGGGGLFNAGGTLVVMSSTIMDNIADGASGSGGGILNDMGSLSVNGCTISGNMAMRAGGGIEDNSMAGATLILDEVDLLNNTLGDAPGNGGGLHITGPGDSEITGGTVSGNTAASEGGGLWNGSGVMTVEGTLITENIASGAGADNGGGGLFNNGGTLMIMEGTIVSMNLADGASGSGGGLLSTDGMVTINGVEFTGNAANRAGGAIEIINGDMSVYDSIFDANDVNGSAGTPAPGNGGAFHLTGMVSEILFENCSFTNNIAGREGGAVWNQSGSVLNVTSCILDSNSAMGEGTDDGGGAAFNNGGITVISASTLSNNTAAAAGGAVHDITSSQTIIQNSTLSGNSAMTFGGAVYNAGEMIQVDASTIAFNMADRGAGLAAMNPISIRSTIVANNVAITDGTDIMGMVSSDGFNIIGDDDLGLLDGVSMNTDLLNMDPMLDVLADNGGATWTHALLPTSPAYNAGDPMDMSLDQIGQSVFMDVRDIGAFEAQTVLTSIDDEPIISNTSEFNLYPNPAVDRVFLRLPESLAANTAQIEVFDAATAKRIASVTISNGQNYLSLDNYPAGTYILSLRTNEEVLRQKLIVQ